MLYGEALTLFQHQNDPWNTAIVLGGLGDVTAELGEYDAALNYFRTALQMSFDIHAQALTLALLLSVAILFNKQHEIELTATLTAIIAHHPEAPPGIKAMAVELLTSAPIGCHFLAVPCWRINHRLLNGFGGTLTNWQND